MSGSLDFQKLNAIFQPRQDILDGIKRAADTPGRIALFNEIANHIHDTIGSSGEPAHKRRRVDVAQPTTNGTKPGPIVNTNAADEAVELEIKEISVSVPQRKKFELCFTTNHLYARAPNTTAPIPAISYAWKDIEYAFYLPVPEKTQVQHNYVLFPRGTYLPSKTNPPTEEALVFTVPSTAPKQGTIGGPEAGSASSVADEYKTLFHWAINKRLKIAGNGVEVVSADPNKFHSMMRQPHRPNEKAVHVKAFRGSKDGYLFFLENGILWGFKKPLMFIPLNRIVATSYTGILQRTFNLSVEVFATDGDGTEEIEFSMLDQEDYGTIDEYIKRNRLQDRSMAEQRKAKLELAENRGPKKNGEAGEDATEAAEGDGLSELQRAQNELEQQLQDDEDEDEEDYDPGSEGDSEGSGDSDDDDDDDDDDDEDEDDEEEGEEGEGAENAEEDAEAEGEEEEEEDEPVEEPKPVQPPPKAPITKAAVTKAPATRGWATMNTRRNDDVDMEEKFDVVG